MRNVVPVNAFVCPVKVDVNCVHCKDEKREFLKMYLSQNFSETSINFYAVV
jgi:hypothetical protein